MLKLYKPIDLRKLDVLNIPNCEFHLHEPSSILDFSDKTSQVFFGKQDDLVDLDGLTSIFTDSYRAPEVYTAIIKNCIVSPRCPKLPRYWGIFFEDYYAYNFINNEAKVRFQQSNIFKMEENNISLNLNNINKVHINGLSVWFYPFKNIDHLLRECLPSLININKLGYPPQDLNFICPEITDDIIYFLEQFGVPSNRIIKLDNYWMSFDKLILPCFSSFGHLHTPTKYYIDVINLITKENNSTENSPERIYVSRRNANIRKIINEDIIIDDLKERGFEVIEPGEYSKIEQMHLFSNAKIIVGAHGMGIANSVFSNNLKLLLEIMNTDYNRVSYFRTAQLKNSIYAAYYVSPLNLAFCPKDNKFGNVLIDREKFIHYLDFLLQKVDVH